MPPPSRDALIAELGSIFADEPQVRLALLFGSRARDAARPGSDVDLAVDAPWDTVLELAARVSERLGIGVDVVALTNLSIPMLEELIRDSVTVYEAQPGSAAAWRSRTLALLETDRPWYRRMREAWLARVARDGVAGG